MRFCKKLAILAIAALAAASLSLAGFAFAATDEDSLMTGRLAAQTVGTYSVDLFSEGYQTAVNPYHAYRSESPDGSGGECTWYAWGRTYEKLGVQLPGPGDGRAWHARYWADNCAAYGYPTGGEARADSIMVEDDGSATGHVYYVERVEGGYAYVTEGNYLGRYHEDAINLATRVRDSWPGHVLGSLSYVYLMQDNPIDVAGSGVSLKKGAVKESAKTVSPFKVANAVTSYSFKDAGSSKYLSVGADGKVTVRKGVLAGTYTAKATVHADGSARYKEKDVAVEAKVQVVSPPATPNPMFLETTPLAAGFKASWKKVSRADGYEVAYFTAKDSSGKWSVAKASGGVSSKSVTGLRQECLYTVKVRAFARAIDGKSYYSGWCGLSNVKTKAAAYKVFFKANGGKGTMAAQKIACGKSTVLAANKFKRSGFAFAGWNTKANGKGKAYKNKAKVKNLAAAGKTATLYAQWRKATVTPYVKVDSASFGSNTVAGARFQVLSYTAYDGGTKYRITMTKSGTTKTLAADSGDRCVTNGRYLFYSKPSGSKQYVGELGYSIEKTTLYRLDIRTGGLRMFASGLYQRPYGCDGKRLFYSTDRGLYGNDLYTLDLKSGKKRLMTRGVSDATYSNGYVITTPHHNDGTNLPVYSFKPNGTGKKAIAKALMVRVLKNRVYYIAINDKNPSLYRKYSCTLRGGSRKAVTGWGDFHDVEFSHDLTKP